MSLMRLLSAGKSLVGVNESTSRYRMGKPGMMPKFGSGNNPFRSGVTQAEGQGGMDSRPPRSASSWPNEANQERMDSNTDSITKSPGLLTGVDPLQKCTPSELTVTRPRPEKSAPRPEPKGNESSVAGKSFANTVARPR